MQRREQKVLIVTSVSENEGKSSVAANLALALAEKGRKVLLIDVDLKKPALYKVFEKQQENRKYLSDYLEKKAGVKDVLFYEKKERIYTVFQKRVFTMRQSIWIHQRWVRSLTQAGKNGLRDFGHTAHVRLQRCGADAENG